MTCRFQEDPKKEAYLELLDYLFKVSEEFSLLIYPKKYSDKAVKLYKELEHYITDVNYLKPYPHLAYSLYSNNTVSFQADEETLEIINQSNDNGFFCWISPELMDDLCFYKENKRKWIHTVAHEKILMIWDETDEDTKDVENIKKIDGILIKEYS